VSIVQPLLTSDDKHVFTAELQAQTGPRGGWSGRLRECSAERVSVVDRPVQQVLPHLWNIKNVEYCERKADDVQVTAEQSWTGRYVIRGRIFGVIPGTDRSGTCCTNAASTARTPSPGPVRCASTAASPLSRTATAPASGTTSGTCCRDRPQRSSRS
jgi:hypothetical protein